MKVLMYKIEFARTEYFLRGAKIEDGRVNEFEMPENDDERKNEDGIVIVFEMPENDNERKHEDGLGNAFEMP